MSAKVPFTLCASDRVSPGTNAARSASIVSLNPTSSSTGMVMRYGRIDGSFVIARITPSRIIAWPCAGVTVIAE